MGVRVREKPKGSGVFWIFIEHHGRRKAKKIGRDRKKALEIAEKVSAKLVLGDLDLAKKEKPGPEVPTFKEYATLFLSTYSRLNHKQSTIDSYNGILKNHVQPVFGSYRLDEITRKQIKDFIIAKQNKGLAANTVRVMRTYMSSIFTQALDDELISVNPAAGTGRFIKKPESAHNVQPLSWEEKELFEQSVKEHFPRYYPLFVTSLRTGMRIGEVVALKPGDIDFNGRFIEVRRGAVLGRVSTPKSGKIRRVDMSNQLAEVLKAHQTWTKRETLKNGWQDAPEWLFFNEAGSMVDVNVLRKRVFKKALEKANLREIRIHDLRHTYATLRIQAGHNIADVSRQLGHHSIKITVDTYYHWMPGSNADEVNELDRKTAPKRNPSATSHENQMKKGAATIANPL